MSSVNVLGRAWIYDTGDPSDVELWVHEFEPTDVSGTLRSSEDWAREHFAECYSDEDLRQLLGLPEEGNFQVLFKGKLEGFVHCGFYGDEWDEQFEVEEVKFETVPDAYIDYVNEPPTILGVEIPREPE